MIDKSAGPGRSETTNNQIMLAKHGDSTAPVRNSVRTARLKIDVMSK
jgi:hypothetical protein